MKHDPQINQTAQSDMRGYDDYSICLGDEMRGRRATLGKSLLDVEQELKIRALLVDAIEKADPMAFDADWLISGHVRSYARYLGMDPDDAFERFCREGDYNPKQTVIRSPQQLKAARLGLGGLFRWRSRTAYPSPLGQMSDTGDSRLAFDALGSTLVLLALTGGIVYVGWAVYDQVQRVADTQVEQTQTIPVPDISSSRPGQRNDSETATSSPADPDQIASPLEMGSIGAMDPNTTGFFTGQSEPDNSTYDMAPVLVARTNGEIGSTDDESSKSADASRIIIVPSRNTWIRITRVDGTRIYEKVLVGGEQYLVPKLADAPRLRAGNAGSLYFVIGDQVFGPAGSGEDVIKDVELSAESLRQRYNRLPTDQVPLEIRNLPRLSEAVASSN